MGIKKGEDRFYRRWHSVRSGIAYEVNFRQTNLWVRSSRDFSREVLNTVVEAHRVLNLYASKNPAFFPSLKPLPLDPLAPPVVKRMLQAALEADVGPMASVAGLIAELVGRRLMELDPEGEIVVENGGDCFLFSSQPVVVEILPDYRRDLKKPLLRISIEPEYMPVSLCTSSSRVGHSLSFGRASAVTVLSEDGAFADAAATSICNQLKSREQLKDLLEIWGNKKKILGLVAIVGDCIGFMGSIKLV